MLGFIADLEEVCRKQQDSTQKQPTGAMEPDGDATSTEGTSTTTTGNENEVPSAEPPVTETAPSGADSASTDTPATETAGADATGTGVQVAELSGETGASITTPIGGDTGGVLDDEAGSSLIVAKAGLGSNFLSIGDLESTALLSLAIAAGPLTLARSPSMSAERFPTPASIGRGQARKELPASPPCCSIRA